MNLAIGGLLSVQIRCSPGHVLASAEGSVIMRMVTCVSLALLWQLTSFYSISAGEEVPV